MFCSICQLRAPTSASIDQPTTTITLPEPRSTANKEPGVMPVREGRQALDTVLSRLSQCPRQCPVWLPAPQISAKQYSRYPTIGSGILMLRHGELSGATFILDSIKHPYSWVCKIEKIMDRYGKLLFPIFLAAGEERPHAVHLPSQAKTWVRLRDKHMLKYWKIWKLLKFVKILETYWNYW